MSLLVRDCTKLRERYGCNDDCQCFRGMHVICRERTADAAQRAADELRQAPSQMFADVLVVDEGGQLDIIFEAPAGAGREG